MIVADAKPARMRTIVLRYALALLLTGVFLLPAAATGGRRNDQQAYRDVVRSLEYIPQEGAAPLR